jgi:uncharacterized protein (DUF1697 family)
VIIKRPARRVNSNVRHACQFVKYAAFFRNLNLGRLNCPTKVQFEDAFAGAGANSVASFQTNGTMIFTSASNVQARRILAGARAMLRDMCGLKEPAYLRSIEYLNGLAALNPFAAVEPESVYERCTSFLHPSVSELPELPIESKRGDVQLLKFTGTEVLSVSRKVGNTPGSPNAFLEKLLGLPVTTRSWSTVTRIVERHA